MTVEHTLDVLKLWLMFSPVYHTLSSNVLTLPPMDPYGPSSRWFDIFLRGTNFLSWNISAAPYLEFSQTAGVLSLNATTDIRVWVSVDWSQLTPGNTTTTTINISSSAGYGTQYSMPQLILPLNYTVAPSNISNGFIETDGHISIEAEHYSRISNTNTAQNISYETIPNLSRTLSGVTLFPVTADSLSPSTGPALEYDLYTFSDLSSGISYNANLGTSSTYNPNSVNVTLILGPSLNTIPERPLRYAVQFDDQPIQTIQYILDQPAGANPTGWLTAVADAAWRSTTMFDYLAPGVHTLRVWELELGVVLQKIVIDFGGVRPSYLGPPESYRV